MKMKNPNIDHLKIDACIDIKTRQLSPGFEKFILAWGRSMERAMQNAWDHTSAYMTMKRAMGKKGIAMKIRSMEQLTHKDSWSKWSTTTDATGTWVQCVRPRTEDLKLYYSELYMQPEMLEEREAAGRAKHWNFHKIWGKKQFLIFLWTFE